MIYQTLPLKAALGLEKGLSVTLRISPAFSQKAAKACFRTLKSECWILKQAWASSSKGDFSLEHLYTIGAKEKRAKDATQGIVTSRGLLMPESWFQMFEALYKIQDQSKPGCMLTKSAPFI